MERGNRSGGLVWKLVTLPISMIAGSLGLVSSAIGLGLWMAGGVLSFSLGMLGVTSSGSAGGLPAPPASEAASFVARFEREYGSTHPGFAPEGFTDALRRSRREGRQLFVYLHRSPESPDTAAFCRRTLGSEALSAFVDENFVAWGGNVGATEGLKMSKSFGASRFPFCAVVESVEDQRISLLQKFEGPKTPEEMLSALQRVVADNAAAAAVGGDAEERGNDERLREEQDAATYQAALETDQAKERQRKEEHEQLERETSDAQRKLDEEEDAGEKETSEDAERQTELTRKLDEEEDAGEKETSEDAEGQTALVISCVEESSSLGPEPEKGPNVTQVLVRLPNGERKGRRFDRHDTLRSVYDFVDSSDCLDVGSYTLVTFFPRVLYGHDKMSSTLDELGLHPQASLFVELIL